MERWPPWPREAFEGVLDADLLMCLDGGAQVAFQTLLAGSTQLGGLVEGLLCCLRELNEVRTS
jgi:hypothetical protein